MTDMRSVAWISPPGETIEDLLEERGWTKAELASRLGCTPKHVSQLLAGRAPIHAEMATALSRVLGSTPEFWLEREARFRAAEERRKELDGLSEESDWLGDLPYSWMVKEGLVASYSHRGEKVEAALRYFGVANVEAWHGVYGKVGAVFRRSNLFQSRQGSLATWLRRAELEAVRLSCSPWSEAGFRSILSEIRTLTLEEDPEVFRPALVEMCAAQGVAVVFAPTPPKCPASGVTRWLTPTKALIALSQRYKTNDTLWFTFFHEAAHLLLHSKKMTFIEGMEGLDQELEEEADTFARDLLIPPEHGSELVRLKSASTIRAFAHEVGVHPGIVVGRLQKEGRIPWRNLNSLKVAL